MKDDKVGLDTITSRLLLLFWFSLFTVSSVCMVLLNKYCITKFPHPFSILCFQNFTTIALNLMGSVVGIFKIHSFTQAQFRMFIFPTFLFVAMLATSLIALPTVSIATTVVFRAASTCLVAFGDSVFFHRQFSHAELSCLFLVLVGAFIYAAGDIAFDRKGYAWMLLNSLMFTSSQLYEKWAVVKLDQTAVGISCVQNIMSLPILVALGFATHEDPARSLATISPFSLVALLVTGLAGCSLSVCYMSLSKHASATSISLAGNFNKLAAIVAGAFVFRDPLTPTQAAGLLLSMASTLAFSNPSRLPAALPRLPRRRAAIAAAGAAIFLWAFISHATLHATPSSWLPRSPQLSALPFSFRRPRRAADDSHAASPLPLAATNATRAVKALAAAAAADAAADVAASRDSAAAAQRPARGGGGGGGGEGGLGAAGGGPKRKEGR